MSPAPAWCRVMLVLLPRAERTEIGADLLEWYGDRRRRQPRWRADVWLASHVLLTAVRLRWEWRRPTGLGTDVRTTLRQFRLAPGFTFAIVAALALGIGTTTSVFSLVNAAFFAPVAVPEPDRVVVLGEQSGTRTVSVSYPNFLDWKARARSFTALAAYQPDTATLRHGSSATRLKTYRVSREWVGTLGVAPFVGRSFVAGDHAAGAPLTVLLSHRTWTRLFGADPSVVGTTVSVNELPHTIIGVMAPGFDFYRDGDAWIPMEPFVPGSEMLDRRVRSGTAVVGRLARGVTAGSARLEMEGIARTLASDFPDANKDLTITVDDLRSSLAGPGGRPLWLLLGAVLGLLAVGCLNAANLLSARLASRTHEFALRTALGAAAGRVARQLMVEGLVLALAAGAIGSLLGWGLVKAAVRLAPPGIPGLATAAVDGRVLAFALLLSMIIGLVFGLVPLAHIQSRSLLPALGDSARTSTGSRRWRRVRVAMVMGQVALSLTLVSGSTLMAQTLIRLVNIDIGFDPAPVLAAGIQLNTPGSPEQGRERTRLFYQQLIDGLEARPGVLRAAVANPVPLSGSNRQNRYWIEGQPYTGPADLIRGIDTASVSPGYFETLGIAVVRGRTFDATDNGPVSVMVVDQTFAERYWPGDDPIGKRLGGGPPGGPNPPATVIGVVTPVRQADVAHAPKPQVYLAQAQFPLGGTLLVRTAGDPLALADLVRAEVAALDTGAPVFSLRQLDELVSSSLALSRFSTAVLTVFAIAGLALAGLGVYGLAAFDVAQRRREIGVRLALGASSGAVQRAVLRQAMAMVLSGAALGLAGSIGLARALGAVFASLTPGDPSAYAVSVGVVALAGLAGSLVPSFRASRIDPIEVLR